MRKSIRYIVALAASLLPLCAGACGPGIYYYPRQVHYSFLSGDIYNEGSRPFGLNYGDDDIYSYQDGYKPEWLPYKDNIDDWVNYFENCVSREDVYGLFYKPDTSLWYNIQDYVRGKTNEIMLVELKDNKLLKLMRKEKRTEVLDYFSYAKQCEVVCSSADYWNSPNSVNYWGNPSEYDSLASIQLLAEGKKLYAGSKDKDLRIRYAYQLVRLAHYGGKFKQAEKFYKEMIAKSGTRLKLKFYALEQAAGAVYKQGRKMESNRMFVQVYDSCPSRRWNSYEGLSIHSQQDWQNTYAICNPREREILYSVLPFQSEMPADKTAQLNAAYKQGPDAEYLRAMVAKELRRMEIVLLPVKPLSPWSTYDELENKPSSAYINFLENFIKARITDKKVKDKAFWTFAAGYMAFMRGKYSESNQHFAQLEKEPSAGKPLLLQARKVQMLNEVKLAEIITPAFEKTLKAHFDWMIAQPKNRQNQDLIIYLFGALKDKYLSNKQIAKAELCKAAHLGVDYDLWLNPHTAPLEELIAFTDTKQKSEWDRWLLELMRYDRNDLIEIRGTRMLSNYQFEDAAREFEKLPENYILKNGRDTIHPAVAKYDYTWYDEPVYSYNTYWSRVDSCLLYNKKQFAYRMMALQNRLKTEPHDSAHINSVIGNELLSITYWGGNWRLVDYYMGSWSVSIRTRYTSDFEEVAFKPDDVCKAQFVGYFDCTPAKNYYLKAANQVKDKEQSARYLYMAAVCEWNNRSVSGRFDPDKLTPYGPLFARLRDEYRDTQFRRELISGCSVFEYYCEAKKKRR